jgi:putative DNA primase/helicase
VEQLIATSDHESRKTFNWDLNEDLPSSNMVIFQNGVLLIDEYLKTGEAKLLDHSPRWFSLSKLDFEFNPHKEQPRRFLSYLYRVQPDEEVQKFLQEWVAYCLIPDTTLERFVFFIGEGANGKSVFLVILRVLLGLNNVSSLGLGAFNSEDKFSIVSTIGKLANIDADLSDVDKLDEGFLKKYVSGEFVPVQEKHKSLYYAKPTARLTFAMNRLPRSVDRSIGLWRRLIVVPWNETIPIEERNPHYLKEKYWKESGDLPGIFNWAMEGLKRLKTNGRFTEPPLLTKALSEYQADSNPTRQFIDDYLRERTGSQVSTRDVYQFYKWRMEEMGNYVFGASQFTKEVKKRLPAVNVTDNAVSQGEGQSRCRNWINLVLDK